MKRVGAVLIIAAGSLLGSRDDSRILVPQFADMSATCGITFEHICGSPREKNYIFEAKGGGLAAFDYNNDGLMDLLLVQGSTLDRVGSGDSPHSVLYENQGGWKFVDISERAGLTAKAWGMGVGIADYDNDGFADIYLTNLGPNILYHNNGNGTFTDVTSKAGVGDPRWSTSAAFGDYDADGDLDLYVPNYLDVGPSKLPARVAGVCDYQGEPVMCGPRGLAGAGDSFYCNNGDGTFTEISQQSRAVDKDKYFGLGVVWADIDNDSDLDVYVANDATPNLLFVNSGNGTFEEQGFLSGLAVSGDGREQASMGVDVADYDNDGLLDAYCTHFAADYSTLYHNDGNLVFTDVTAPARIQTPEWPLVGWGTRFVDLNHDGWKDIFHSNGHVYPYLINSKTREVYHQPKTLYLNRGDGTFLDASTLAGPALQKPTVSRGVAFADFDNDGDIDCAVATLNGSPQLFRNDVPAGHHWVMFRTVGAKSNRDGIGARITVTAGNLKQVWEIKRTVGIYSSSDPRAHFGLGPFAKIDSLSVRWPSGKIQEFKDVTADAHYVLHEEEGLRKGL
ncbi:MAG: CRTAC1 family protein [Acidobacteriota bacterium]